MSEKWPWPPPPHLAGRIMDPMEVLARMEKLTGEEMEQLQAYVEDAETEEDFCVSTSNWLWAHTPPVKDVL